MSNTCLIFGVNGQDGFFLANYLLARGYTVVGTTRDATKIKPHLLQITSNKFKIVECEIETYSNVSKLFLSVKPDFVFNFAAQSSVALSFDQPQKTISGAIQNVLSTLEVIRNEFPDTRYYNASSSEVFGSTFEKITSDSPMLPRSPYGVAKASVSMMVKLYRETYKLHVVNGYTFNHESVYRNQNFVTQKIIDYVYMLKKNGFKHKLLMGNIDVSRDWGLAVEYVEAMYRLVKLDDPHDCVVCTGHTMSLREFLKYAFLYIDEDYNDYIELDPTFVRQNEVFRNVGDPSEAYKLLNWKAKTHTNQVVDHLLQQKFLIHD